MVSSLNYFYNYKNALDGYIIDFGGCEMYLNAFYYHVDA